ncbi:MAG TPA: hypothetical protein VF455_06230 [Chryseobacterium sp.]
MKTDRQNLKHLSFSFENDTVENYNIYKLLEDIESLGYHSYAVRRIAPFEVSALNKKNNVQLYPQKNVDKL